MSNAIMVIFPYKREWTWVFDDAATGLVAEPFVSGMPEMIDILVADIPEADKGFRLLFSANSFPGYQAELEWLREECSGNWYLWKARNMEGWLCPALFKYFDVTPPRIYCRAESLPKVTTTKRSH